MPAEHSELASHGHRGDLMTTPRTNPREKSMYWTGTLAAVQAASTSMARVTAAHLTDAAVMAAPSPDCRTRRFNPK